MIISHKYKFIFIKTQKTASSSIELFLSQYCGNNDIFTPMPWEEHKGQNYLGFYGLKSFFIEVKINGYKKSLKNFLHRVKFYDHMPANIIKTRVSSNIWNNYYVFCFERNPWDKMVSYYFWICRYRDLSFSDFLKERKYCKNIELYSDPQSAEGKLIVDHVALYEKIHVEMHNICAQLGIPFKKKLNFNAKTGFRKVKSYRNFYSDAERLQIQNVFQDEIALHGYKF